MTTSDSNLVPSDIPSNYFQCSKLGVYHQRCEIGKDLCPAYAEFLVEEADKPSDTMCIIEDYKRETGATLEMGLDGVVSISGLNHFAHWANLLPNRLRAEYDFSTDFFRSTCLMISLAESISVKKPCKTCGAPVGNVRHDCKLLPSALQDVVPYYNDYVVIENLVHLVVYMCLHRAKDFTLHKHLWQQLDKAFLGKLSEQTSKDREKKPNG